VAQGSAEGCVHQKSVEHSDGKKVWEGNCEGGQGSIGEGPRENMWFPESPDHERESSVLANRYPRQQPNNLIDLFPSWGARQNSSTTRSSGEPIEGGYDIKSTHSNLHLLTVSETELYAFAACLYQTGPASDFSFPRFLVVLRT
jgi:hypothetical protein